MTHGRIRVLSAFTTLLTMGALIAQGASSADQPGGSVQVVLTTGDQAKLLQTQPPVSFTRDNTSPAPIIVVNDSKRYQQIDGFGASLTDSSAWLMWNKLNESQRKSLMEQLFSPSVGIGISFLRQPMGASDFAVHGNYSYDDVPAGQSDPDLAKFSIAHDREYTIPLLKQALAINSKVNIVALPWSPPAWMKSNHSMNAGHTNLSSFPALAQYFVKFIEAYQQEGIPIYAISVQNEPLNETPGYPSEYLSARNESNFISGHLGPALKRAGLQKVKIFGYEHNWDKVEYPMSLMKGPSREYLAGTAFHCYGGDVSAQSQVKTAVPDKDIWFTECSGTVGSNFAGDLVWNAEKLLIGATRNWARSISLWNIALDQHSGPKNGGCKHCRGVVTIDTSSSPATIGFNVEYYVLGHLGKFVAPGAVRIDSTTFSSGNIEDVAFRNPDGSIVLLVLNASKDTQEFSVNWKSASFRYTLPPQSVATFKWT